MPLLNTGHSFELIFAISCQVELTDKLLNLSVSSELMESTALLSPAKVNGYSLEITLPDSLVNNLYTLYHYNEQQCSWEKISNYTKANNKVVLKESLSGLLLAFPFDAFRDTFYADGEYVYEMYLARADKKVYRNIRIGSTSFFASKHIEMLFAFKDTGPWLNSIESAMLIGSFYMKVVVQDITSLTKSQLIPSELISISCITCE